MNEKEAWLWENPKSLDMVLQGLEEAKMGKFVDNPPLIPGATYTIRHDHPKYAGQIGTFEFRGGPEQNVIVLSMPKNYSNQRYIEFICVDARDIVFP